MQVNGAFKNSSVSATQQSAAAAAMGGTRMWWRVHVYKRVCHLVYPLHYLILKTICCICCRYQSEINGTKWSCRNVMFYFPCRRLCMCDELELKDDGLHWMDNQLYTHGMSICLLFVCLCVVCLSMLCLSVCMSVCVSVCLSLDLCMYVCVFVYLVCVSVCVVCLSMWCLSVCLSVYLSLSLLDGLCTCKIWHWHVVQETMNIRDVLCTGSFWCTHYRSSLTMVIHP